MNKHTILVTGGAGFIGHHFINHRLRETEDRIVNLDSLTYAGDLGALKELEGNPRYAFAKGDVNDLKLVDDLIRRHNINLIVHFAAESHVDRSIASASSFIQTNIAGTQMLLDAARKHGVRFIHISTDEVYGSLGETGVFTEASPLAPRSPYAASKASSDCLVLACYHTFGLPVNVTRCTNNYGPRQFPEKFIPKMIIEALRGNPLPLYGNGENVRDWIHVHDHCTAIDAVIEKGVEGEVYNIGSSNERKNLEVARFILEELELDDSRITYVDDRPGHDYRYALNSDKIRNELGWAPRYEFEAALKKTIRWYKEHRPWWEWVLKRSEGL
ncbi:dTDP-glucose 4,6-dehydratase [Rossellomorea marisflavi]|uniref:dTDP-glucose 4,6-dehydratase n=1 Tax=Rossellomorea marisflavi TaxID=189381 RepID=UPI00203FFED8|nr:dTDP-glucose 4,6-dehydratase [Rossellomorea marisflavi]MCM2590104.1 dTDP-glucose 4,6-dehydratase [Rossellomorea marisflavi]